MKKRLILFAVGMAALLVFAGCSETKKEVESAVSKVEQEAEELLSEGGSVLDRFVSQVHSEAAKLEEAVEMEGKATLKVLKEDEQTIKYQFTLAEEAAETEVSELEKKAVGLEEQVGKHLEDLKAQGAKDVKAVVQFVDKEGNELYSKLIG